MDLAPALTQETDFHRMESCHALARLPATETCCKCVSSHARCRTGSVYLHFFHLPPFSSSSSSSSSIIPCSQHHHLGAVFRTHQFFPNIFTLIKAALGSPRLHITSSQDVCSCACSCACTGCRTGCRTGCLRPSRCSRHNPCSTSSRFDGARTGSRNDHCRRPSTQAEHQRQAPWPQARRCREAADSRGGGTRH